MIHPTPDDVGRPARVFVSGHSLTDLPMPTYLERIARSLGMPMDWNRQFIGGSAIKWRARGRGNETGWAGYSTGDNRDGAGLNVVEELRRHPYDMLVITEQHGLIEALVWDDTVRYLRHYHELLIAGNPAGRTYFYEPWLGIPGKTQVRRWIDYERMASPLWQCVVSRVNASLAAEGRPDRLTSLPAALALAELVERATQGPGVPGITANSPAQTLNRLLEDNVHYRPLGAYYLALVVFSVIFETSPLGAWAPDSVTSVEAASLQRVALESTERHRCESNPLTPVQCRAMLQGPFLDLYFAHMRDDHWTKRPGNPVRNQWRRLKQTLRTRRELRTRDPLAWDAADDPDYWLPPP